MLRAIKTKIRNERRNMMGWTWYRATHYFPNGGIDRRAECDAYFMEGLNRGHYEVLKSTIVGTVYYAAVKKLKKIRRTR